MTNTETISPPRIFSDWIDGIPKTPTELSLYLLAKGIKGWGYKRILKMCKHGVLESYSPNGYHYEIYKAQFIRCLTRTKHNPGKVLSKREKI
jgi:hypothetical protein